MSKTTDNMRKLVSAPNVSSLSAAGGLALFYVWLIAHSRLFSFQEPNLFNIVSLNYASFSMLLNAVLLLTLFYLYLRKRTVPFGKGYFFTIALCLGLGYFTGYLLEMSSVSNPAFSVFVIAQCIFTNIGMTCLSLEWIRILGTIGTRSSVTILTFSAFIAAAFFALSSLINLFELPLMPLIIPLGSVLSLYLFYKEQKRIDRKKIQEYGKETGLNIPYRLLATVFISDFVCSAILASIQTNLSFDYKTSALCYMGSALLLILAVFKWKFDFNSLIYKTAYLIMGLGCLILALPFEQFSMIGLTIHQIGYRFMLIMTWLMSAWLIEQRKLSANWVFPVVTGIAFLGQFTGQLFSGICASLPGTNTSLEIEYICGLFILLTAALLLMDTKNIQTGWGFITPNSIVIPTGERIDVICAEMASEFGLTARETEVFTLIAKGYSRDIISKKLVVSSETVKSCANSMYSKIGMHSRQDLMSCVNKRMEETKNFLNLEI